MGFFDFLFGGGESKEPTITQLPAPTPNLPNLNELNSIGTARINAGSPWTYGPYRAMDYFRGTQATPNMVPQMHQMYPQGLGQGGLGGMMGPQMGQFGMQMPQQMQQPGPGLMGDFSQAMGPMQQPQYSPLAWAMQLGQLFNQLGGMYQNQMGMPQQGQQQGQMSQQPLTREQPPQQQNQSGGNQ